MGQVAVVTDSMAYIEGNKTGITVLPFTVQIGEKRYRDGIDITREEFFQALERDHASVSVLPPETEQFQRIYAQLSARTDQILSIHVSGKLSHALANAQRASRSILGRAEIVVLDSLSSSLGLGILASHAARMAAQGAGLDEIVRAMRKIIAHLYMVFYTADLESLQRNRYLTASQALLGSLLNIKPILFLEDGRLMALEKVRTHEKAVEKLYEFVAEFSEVKQAAILQRHPTPNQETKMLLTRLETVFSSVAFPIIQYDPVLASHLGPAATGVVVYEEV